MLDPATSQSSQSVNAVVHQTLSQVAPTSAAVLAQLSQEEHQTVIHKLSSFVTEAAHHLPVQEELYLEQQLSDMLGYNIVAELDGHRLPYSVGVMAAHRHLRRTPTDTAEQHEHIQEAGIETYRSGFGWFTQMGHVTEQMANREAYGIGLPLDTLPDWSSAASLLRQWYVFRKVLVINPLEQQAVVAVVHTYGHQTSWQYQSSGSPEVIRQGKIWTPAAKGRVLLFFIDDPEDSVPLGPRSLAYSALFTG